MKKIGLIDIAGEPLIYIMEKKAGSAELKETKTFSCTGDYEISIAGLPGDMDEFYLSLPLSAMNFRIVELPFSDKEKMREVLPFELDGIILNPPSPPFAKGGMGGFIFDGIILGSSNGKIRVLAVYTAKAVLKKIIERLKTFNIDPVIITSIELNRMVKDFDPERLLNPAVLSPDERVNASMEEVKDNTINLRRGELAYTGNIEKMKKSLRLTAALCIISLIFFTASVALKTISVKKETAILQSDMKKIYSGVFPTASIDKKAIGGLYQFRAKMKELEDKEKYLVGVSPLDLLLGLSNIERGSVTFNEIKMEGERVMLKGEAASFSDVQRIKEGLGNILNEVNISDTKTSLRDRIVFTIAAKEKKV